jgi:hemolysin III
VPQPNSIDRIGNARFSLAEERAHYLSHGVGAAIAVPAVALLVLLAARQSLATFIGCGVYGGALVLMYAASTAYHATPPAMHRTKHVFHLLDHCAIFLLISGTYTPLALTVLHNSRGYMLLAVVWVLSFYGLYRVIVRRNPKHGGPVLLYLAIGWAVALTLPELLRALGDRALVLLVAGGIFYTLGVPFYALRRLRYHHAIWHGFVLAGSAFHFIAMFNFVVSYPS